MAGSCVLDASALIAFLLREPGEAVVASRIPNALISAVNYSEVCARSLEQGFSLEKFVFEISRLPIQVIPYNDSIAILAATLKAPTRHIGLSHADRACLALALDRQLPVLTSDRDWLKASVGVEVILFR